MASTDITSDDEFDAVPEHLRPAIRAELDALVRGDRPEQMTWVEAYGDDGATLVTQPEDVWDHEECHVTHEDDGSWTINLPLWTTEESPSDLSAQVDVDASGIATLYDVHVL